MKFMIEFHIFLYMLIQFNAIKSDLIEIQEINIIQYKLIESKGPKHNPLFKMSVSIKDSKICFGSGNSKQQAEQDAASNLLKIINVD